MTKDYLVDYLKTAFSLLRYKQECDDVEEHFLEELSPIYWEAIEKRMIEQRILGTTKDGLFLDSVMELIYQIDAHIDQLDGKRKEDITRVLDWTQNSIDIILNLIK